MLTNKEKDTLNIWLQKSHNIQDPGPLTVNQCARRSTAVISRLLVSKEDKLRLIDIMRESKPV